MKWDNERLVPLEGTYTPLGISGASVLEWVRKDMPNISQVTEEWFILLVELLSKPGYTFDDYLLEHRYWSLDEDMLFELMYGASQFMPKDRRDRFLDVVGVSNMFSTVFSDLQLWEELNLLSRLYFCESDEDLWDVLLDGYGEPQYFLKGYAGMREGILPEYGRFPDAPRTADDERLRRFVVYMTSHNPLIFYGTGGLKD